MIRQVIVQPESHETKGLNCLKSLLTWVAVLIVLLDIDFPCTPKLPSSSRSSGSTLKEFKVERLDSSKFLLALLYLELPSRFDSSCVELNFSPLPQDQS